MPKFQFLFDVGRPSVSFVIEKVPRTTYDFSNYEPNEFKLADKKQFMFVVENRPCVPFLIEHAKKHSCGVMYMEILQSHMFQFVLDSPCHTLQFCVDQRPRIVFDCALPAMDQPDDIAKHSFVFITDQQLCIPFKIGSLSKHSCGELYIGHRFNDELISSALNHQILRLRTNLVGMTGAININALILDMPLLHKGYRDIVLEDWDYLCLDDIDPVLINDHIFGKVRVNVAISREENI